jgi:hypothetical protein
MERLTAQKSTQVAELPDEYRVVGLDHGAPLIRKPNGQVLRTQQNGRPVGGVTEARCRPAARHRDERDRLAARWGATPYTQPCQVGMAHSMGCEGAARTLSGLRRAVERLTRKRHRGQFTDGAWCVDRAQDDRCSFKVRVCHPRRAISNRSFRPRAGARARASRSWRPLTTARCSKRADLPKSGDAMCVACVGRQC